MSTPQETNIPHTTRESTKSGRSVSESSSYNRVRQQSQPQFKTQESNRYNVPLQELEPKEEKGILTTIENIIFGIPQNKNEEEEPKYDSRYYEKDSKPESSSYLFNWLYNQLSPPPPPPSPPPPPHPPRSQPRFQSQFQSRPQPKAQKKDETKYDKRYTSTTSTMNQDPPNWLSVYCPKVYGRIIESENKDENVVFESVLTLIFALIALGLLDRFIEDESKQC